MPILASVSTPRPLTNSPQTLCRGYSFDSIIVTGTPRCRRATPAVRPAIPPPTIVTFFKLRCEAGVRCEADVRLRLHCVRKSLRGEAVAEKAGFGFLHVPAALGPRG